MVIYDPILSVLISCIDRVPLMIEVWHRDKQLSKDVLIGTGPLPLDRIITTDKFKVSVSCGFGMKYRQIYHKVLCVCHDKDNVCRIKRNVILRS